MKFNGKKLLKEYSIILFGSILYALAFNWCFQPNDIAFGGFTGVGQIVNQLIPLIPVGGFVFVLNLPLFVLGIKKIGWGLLVSSIVAMSLGSFLIDGMAATITFPPMEPLLASIYGGVLMGISMGMMLSVGATTGGTELLARLLKFPFPHLSMGKLCLICDAVVIISYAAVFHSLNNALYGVIAIYISSLVMDAVIYGTNGAKMAHIITGNPEQLEKALLELDFGITIVDARGGYTGHDRHVILCAVKRSQIVPLKAAVSELDPDAFLIVCEAHEVLGRRFGSYNPNGL